MPKSSALFLCLAIVCAPALPQQRFELEPICEGPVLKGLRGRVPKVGLITIYIPAGICDDAPTRPVKRTT